MKRTEPTPGTKGAEKMKKTEPTSEAKAPTKTPEWCRTLRQAQADARAGRGTFYASDKELLKALK
jgi:hypothetical protein